MTYYSNTKLDGVDYIEAADLEAIEAGFNSVDTDKANKAVPAVANDLAALSATGDLVDSGKTPPTGEIVGTTDSQTLTNKLLGSYAETVYTLSGTTLDPANGPIQVKTLSGSTTLTDSFYEGESMLLHLVNASSHTITWPTISWVGGVAPTFLTSGAVLALWKVGSTLYSVKIGDLT